ncbi:TetR/AcrR family transcriptional regulator [Nocardia callitridis]|uniref:TetR/AcrR family transcriptional regulator n=1 Tax=Nocardia callitridis TaxID=648753 RepID=A0ABP9KKY7_9NOCA
MQSDEIPAPLRRLWRLPDPPVRVGRPSNLDVDTVIAAAVRLADEYGLDAVTLPRVAKEIGVTAMSLYRYVGSKSELLQLMLDAATTPRAPESEPDGAWRTGLRDCALALWELYRSRPWLPRVPIETAPSGPHQLAWLERVLATLSSSGLGWGEKMIAVMLVGAHVRQSVLLTQDLTTGRQPDEQQSESEYRYALAMRELVDPQQFPEVSAMFASDVFAESAVPTETTERADFEAGLELVLDGIAARIAANKSRDS